MDYLGIIHWIDAFFRLDGDEVFLTILAFIAFFLFLSLIALMLMGLWAIYEHFRVKALIRKKENRDTL